MIMERHGFSERRACGLGPTPIHPATSAPRCPDEEERLRARLRELARARPRYGYRRMTALLREEGFCVNHKRIQRLCRDEGLRVIKKAEEALPGRRLDRAGNPAAGRPPRPRLGPRLLLRPDLRPARP